jgi:hypothetical protein
MLCKNNSFRTHADTEGLRTSSDVLSTEDYSSSTLSYTGDSGFSDSRAFLKESPPSSPLLAQYYQREPDPDIESSTSAWYTSLITTDVRTGYYMSLNPERLSRIPGIGICLIVSFITYTRPLSVFQM